MTTTFRHLACGLLLVLAAAGFAAHGALAPAAPVQSAYSQAELDQMLAPIALYPDNVLADVLMAATYPLEVVQAARWSRSNADIGGEEAVRGVADMDWDPSVKSLVAFPQILRMMDERLDWTQRLGEAFLGDADRAMDAVQRLRRAAEDQGSLAASDELAVRHEGEEILIESPAPDVVYVPYYDSRVVYGDWWWPDYPPVYWSPWPGYYYSSGYALGWSLGIPVGFDFFYGRMDWGRHRVWTHDRRPFYVHGDRPWRSHEWRHDPHHRQGVAYNNPLLRERFGNGSRRNDRDDRHGSRNPPPARGDSITRPSLRGDSPPRPRYDATPRPAQPSGLAQQPLSRGGAIAQPHAQDGFFPPQVARPAVQPLERAPSPQVAHPRVAQPSAPQYARPAIPAAPLARPAGPAPQVHAAPQWQHVQPAAPVARSAPPMQAAPQAHVAPQVHAAPSAPAAAPAARAPVAPIKNER